MRTITVVFALLCALVPALPVSAGGLGPPIFARRYDRLEFLRPADWAFRVVGACVQYTNVSRGPSDVRLFNSAIETHSIPAGGGVVTCNSTVTVASP